MRLADHVWLLPIYPAREAPIPGATSEMIAHYVPQAQLMPPQAVEEAMVHHLKQATGPQVMLTIGAGSIGQLAAPLAQRLEAIFTPHWG